MTSPRIDSPKGSLADNDFDLPRELIAQEPPPGRGDSRLLVLDRQRGSLEHRRFGDLPALIRPGDLLVMNDTRVFPARLRIRRTTGARGELLLLEADPDSLRWKAIGRPGSALRPGQDLLLDGSTVTAHPLDREGELVHVEFRDSGGPLDHRQVLALCEQVGEVPLPPYIGRDRNDPRATDDPARYQTVFARRTGSAAAPTAGLHFTRKVLDDLERAGAELAHVTLHIGLGTFRPLTEATFEGSSLHRERVEVDAAALEAVASARRDGRRILAVGTTATRVLETLGDAIESPAPYRGHTDLFIKPGHVFSNVTALLTNFHLPRSSLLLLVSAFASRESVLRAYREAIRQKYRFFSYGDAMLIV